ncbi:hypothetical protein [Sulfobacillus harzensis]|uniref:Uncharacterized protein n=1 Tax=Sulfobacillus harzensis TaxID=2729629 RepID=A0A7Y0L4Q2_9FIRM|nr:hypothetical protein [Sulfobacillus harzensis]NMP22646.1 hypothetical protein [Sulfobacillus harzensis]
MSRKWTLEAVLAVLREAGRERGYWTKRAWETAKRRPSTETIINTCGSWVEAWAMAGYERPSRVRRWTRDTIVAEFRAVGSRYGRWLTTEEWKTGHHRPDVAIVLQHFSHWREAWEAAGFSPPPNRRRFAPRGTWNPSAVLDALRAHARSDGTIMGVNDWSRQAYQPMLRTIAHYWGSYTKAVQAAGLRIETDAQRQSRIAHAEWQRAFDNLTQRLGHPPTQQEWDAWEDRPASAATVWKVLHPTRRRTPLQHRLMTIDLRYVAEPRRSWMAAYRDGATLAAIGARAGVTQEWVRQSLQRGVTESQNTADLYDAVQTLDTRQLVDPTTRTIVEAMQDGEPLTAIINATGLSAREVLQLVRQVLQPPVIAASLRRLAEDAERHPILWTDADYRWVDELLRAGSPGVYAAQQGIDPTIVRRRLKRLHAVAQRRPVWVAWARALLDGRAPFPEELRPVLESLATGESLRHVVKTLGRDYAMTHAALRDLRDRTAVAVGSVDDRPGRAVPDRDMVRALRHRLYATDHGWNAQDRE